MGLTGEMALNYGITHKSAYVYIEDVIISVKNESVTIVLIHYPDKAVRDAIKEKNRASMILNGDDVKNLSAKDINSLKKITETEINVYHTKAEISISRGFFNIEGLTQDEIIAKAYIDFVSKNLPYSNMEKC